MVFSGLEGVDRAWIAEHAAGYVVKDADLDYLLDLLEEVGLTTEEAVLELPDQLSSVAVARRFVYDKVVEWGIDISMDDALLVVSELAANALMHAESSSYRVRVAHAGPALRIEVEDDGTGTPEPQPLTETAEHGRGLHLVDALAASWGMDIGEVGGKRVWAELAIPVGAE